MSGTGDISTQLTIRELNPYQFTSAYQLKLESESVNKEKLEIEQKNLQALQVSLKKEFELFHDVDVRELAVEYSDAQFRSLSSYANLVGRNQYLATYSLFGPFLAFAAVNYFTRKQSFIQSYNSGFRLWGAIGLGLFSLSMLMNRNLVSKSENDDIIECANLLESLECRVSNMI